MRSGMRRQERLARAPVVGVRFVPVHRHLHAVVPRHCCAPAKLLHLGVVHLVASVIDCAIADMSEVVLLLLWRNAVQCDQLAERESAEVNQSERRMNNMTISAKSVLSLAGMHNTSLELKNKYK